MGDFREESEQRIAEMAGDARLRADAGALMRSSIDATLYSCTRGWYPNFGSTGSSCVDW